VTGTRIAVIVLVIFLVQVLVNLYRYNMRLAAFHDARAHALTIALASGQSPASWLPDFRDLAATLSPSEVDFGRAPNVPAKDLVDLTREVVRAAPRK
jgi:hypothetical protein